MKTDFAECLVCIELIAFWDVPSNIYYKIFRSVRGRIEEQVFDMVGINICDEINEN